MGNLQPAGFGKQIVSPRPAPGIRNRPVPSFCPPIVIPNLMMSLPGPQASGGIFDNPFQLRQGEPGTPQYIVLLIHSDSTVVPYCAPI